MFNNPEKSNLLVPWGLIFLTHKHESVVLTDSIKQTKRAAYLIQDDVQNKFLRSIHFTVFGFAEAVADPEPRSPSSSQPSPGGPSWGAPPAPVLPAAPCSPAVQADLAGLCFWEGGNFRHQCPDRVQGTILLKYHKAEVSPTALFS